MNILTKESIFATVLEVREVPVPEWGGTVLIRELDGPGRDEFDTYLFVARGQKDDPPLDEVPDGAGIVKDGEFVPAKAEDLVRKISTSNLRAKLVQLCAVNEGGQLLFTDEDVAELGTRSGKALTRLSNVAQEMSGLFKRDIDGDVKN